jgi:hypothetical protein
MRPLIRLVLALAAAALPGAMVVAPARADASPSPGPSVDTSTLSEPTSDTAMLNLLGQQGVSYYPVTSAFEALSYEGPDATLVLDESELPRVSDIDALVDSTFGHVVILNNDASTIDAFAPGVLVDTYTASLTQPTQPSCDQAEASSAGSVDFHDNSAAFTVSRTADLQGTVVGCYPVDGDPTVISYDSSIAQVVILGSATFTHNEYLTEDGNAALAMNIFGASHHLVWLAPSFTPDQTLGNCNGSACTSGGNNPAPGSTTTIPANNGGGGDSGAGRPSLTSLMPTWIWWVLLQLVVAALLTAYWRGRRLGAVVTERLPVTVRAAETVEGHARLYRRANAHGRAAELLRKASASRMAGYFGVPAARAHADPSLLITPVATRLEVTEDLIADLLVGPPPQSEAELVLLADHLDQLEQEVRSS